MAKKTGRLPWISKGPVVVNDAKGNRRRFASLRQAFNAYGRAWVNCLITTTKPEVLQVGKGDVMIQNIIRGPVELAANKKRLPDNKRWYRKGEMASP